MGEKSLWIIVASSYCCIQISRHLFEGCFWCLRNPKCQFLLIILHCKRGTQMWELSFCFFGKASSFPFLGVQVPMIFHLVWQISLLSTALYYLCNDSKHGRQKIHGACFACHIQLCGTPVVIASQSNCLCCSKIKKMLLILLKPFRVNVFFNLYKSL